MDTKQSRGSLRTGLIRTGITLLMVSSIYLVMGLMNVVPLELETIAWNNIRIISGVAITGCLMTAIGYGDE